MDEVREDLIIMALDELEQGHDIEAILDRHPREAGVLRPILETAAGLAADRPHPAREAREASRSRFLAEGQRMRSAAERRRQLPRWRRMAYAVASFALFLFLMGIVVTPLATEAIPGDILYPVKRGMEQGQLWLAAPDERDALRSDFERERNREVYRMLEVGRDGQAGYVGVLSAMDDNVWEIGRITAQITADSEITGTPEVGARVEAHCLVQDGTVYVESLTVLEPAATIGPQSP